MHVFARIVIAGLLSLSAATESFAQAAGGEADALVKIKAKKVDQAYLLPGVDFSGYKKVIIAPSEVAFQKNWLRDMNNQSLSLSRRIADKDAKRIIETTRAGFDEVWAEAFKAAGYEVVTTPGDDVFKLVPTVFDLYINAPDVATAGRSKTYAVDTGQASLSLDVRDATSGALLGRVIDKRTAGTNTGRLEWTNSVTNRADFTRLFKRWAKLAADGLNDLALASPLPEALQPNQKPAK
jgi:hypothetical protein